MNLKTIFNWLAAKDDLPVTLGAIARKTILKGTKLENKESPMNFTRGGRMTERGVTVASCFAAAASVSFLGLMAATPFVAVPAAGYLLTAFAIVAVGKVTGLVAGKVADVATKGINHAL